MLSPTYRYVLCFGFNDGAESGLAVEADGSGARFDCLGDAGWAGVADDEPDLSRAFLFERIDGDWLARVEACGRESRYGEPGRFIVPGMGNGRAAEIGRDALGARSSSYFVAVAHPYLERMQCVEIDADTAEAFAGRGEDLYCEIREFVQAHARVPR
jgi:hypothetical protein